MNYGFIKVASAIPSVRVGDVKYNTAQIENLIAQAEGQGVEVIVFPELSVTGYSCQDLFRQEILLESAETAVMVLLDFTRKHGVLLPKRSILYKSNRYHGDNLCTYYPYTASR